jgi:hypothetical protein
MRSLRLAPAFLIVAAAALFATACDDGPSGPDPDVRLTEELTFIRPAADAPPLANPSVQFYAKRGEDRDVFIYYRPRPGETDSTEFMHFRVRAEALLTRPNGTAFQPGDSVLISVNVIDPSRLILDFQPSGLRFSQDHPAELEISFEEADDDLDGDGDIDDRDLDNERKLSVWRQEAPGQPWYRMATIVEYELNEVDVDLFGFSGYAIAY